MIRDFAFNFGPEMLGRLDAFSDPTSWTRWHAFGKAVYGVPLTPEELPVFQEHTGRTTPRPGGYRTAVLIVGRRAGKSQYAAALAALEAVNPEPMPLLGKVGQVLRGRRGGNVILISQDARAARDVLLRYCREVFTDVEAFKHDLEAETTEALQLRSGARLSVLPCRPAAVRGLGASLVVLDELAHFLSTDGRPTDKLMLEAVRPVLAGTGGRLLILSSPYAQAGALWDLHARHYAREDSAVLVWKGSALSMRPGLAHDEDYLAGMREDPESWRSEVEGEFRSGVGSLFDGEALDACTRSGEEHRAQGVSREWSFDGGGSQDASVLAGGYLLPDGTIFVDLVQGWRAPHNPVDAIAQAAETIRLDGGRKVFVDRYATAFVIDAFKRHGITAELLEKDTSTRHLNMVPLVTAGRVSLPAHPTLLREMRGLVRKTTGMGDRADHPRGAHDDHAAAVSGVVFVLTGKGARRTLTARDIDSYFGTSSAPQGQREEEATEKRWEDPLAGQPGINREYEQDPSRWS